MAIGQFFLLFPFSHSDVGPLLSKAGILSGEPTVRIRRSRCQEAQVQLWTGHWHLVECTEPRLALGTVHPQPSPPGLCLPAAFLLSGLQQPKIPALVSFQL